MHTLLSLLGFVRRIALSNSIDDVNDSTYDDDRWDDWSDTILWFALPPLVCAITLVLGALFGFTSLCSWKDGRPPVVSSLPVTHVSSGAPRNLSHTR